MRPSCHDRRWPVPAATGRCWPVLAKSRSRLARRPWASPAADPAGPRAGHPVLPVHSMPGAFHGRLAGRQLSCRQSACPVACAPRHAATARPDPQGVCAVKGKPARQAFSRIRNFQATLCGQAGIAPGGALLSLWGRFLAGTRQGRRLAALQRAVWQSFGHRRPSSQVSLGRIFFLMQVAGHGIMPTARRNESVADGIREACGSAQTMQGMVRADCRSCRHSQCETRAKASARLAQGPSGKDCLAQIACQRADPAGRRFQERS